MTKLDSNTVPSPARSTNDVGPSINLGLSYAIGAYFIWGLVPLFWKQLAYVNSIELVVHRMLWSFVFVAAYVLLRQDWKVLFGYFKDKVLIRRLAAASILFSANAAIFIWAVNSGHLIETSMGYFINPLFNVTLGVIIFGERLRPLQLLAISSAAAGVLYYVFAFGAVPIIALSLALTFSVYGAFKKSISIPAVHGMAIETSFVLIPCLMYLGFLEWQGVGVFGNDLKTDVMLALGGFITLMPLLLFASAAKIISMTALGITQYIGPSLQLLIGVFIYNEFFGQPQQIAFVGIWIGVLIYTIDNVRHGRQRRRLPPI
ncbi:EamA family transporter RarD [bacterium]|jgi:chloramphenicol-sensitive protein RarD|nr:EamA family transporter RarD [bacterium]